MNHSNDEQGLETLMGAWTVSTTDIRQRVAGAIGAENSSPIAELLREVRALRREMESLRQANTLLHDELFRLRSELAGRRVTRLAPYSPGEGLVRLS